MTISTPGSLVTLTGVAKSYGGVHALVDMHLQVARGAVHALVGENGAGKSTLMKVLAGAVQPDRGDIRIDSEPVQLRSPQAAAAKGVGIVYQELTVFPERSILANLFVDRQPTRFGLIDRTAMERTARPVLDEMGLDLSSNTPVSSLGVGERQLVELTRLLIRKPKLLILDEPNSALNDQETRRLFAVLRRVVSTGTTVVYVSHRLEEVFDIADEITVMRSGKHVWTKPISGTSIPEVVRGMVGMGVEDLFPPRREPLRREEGLVLDRVSVGEDVQDVSLEIGRGEIVGLAGLEGSGTATVLGAVFGTRPLTSGSIRFPDGDGAVRSPTAAARRRISLVPADRKVQGLMLERSVEWNLGQVLVGAIGRANWLDRKVFRAIADRQIPRMRIKTGSGADAVSGLSGGNQQKVVIGKWLEIGPRVFLLDDPTRGVDVGAKAEIYRLIRELAETGATILFRSSELPELAGLADRVLIMFRGRLVGEIPGAAATDETLLTAINTGTVSA